MPGRENREHGINVIINEIEKQTERKLLIDALFLLTGRENWVYGFDVIINETEKQTERKLLIDALFLLPEEKIENMGSTELSMK